MTGDEAPPVNPTALDTHTQPGGLDDIAVNQDSGHFLGRFDHEGANRNRLLDASYRDASYLDATHLDATHLDPGDASYVHTGYPDIDRLRSADLLRDAARRRRRRRIIPLLAVVVIVALVITGAVIVRRALDGFGAADYRGDGTGRVVVKIQAGDTSGDIATILRAQDVVASTAAFTAAARRSGRSGDFQPGWFTMHHQMSGAAAVALLLSGKTRLSTTVTTTEGMISVQIYARLAQKLKIPQASFLAAARDLPNLGLPDGYPAKSVEGFLFPQTYQYDPDVTAAEALQDMTSQYQLVARKLDFAADAAKLKLTPYQALTVASMVEAEARFPADRARVARVVYNRLARKMPLQFDSTSAYGARLLGQDPLNIDYTKAAPYNTRLKTGLPPTPIGNPGQAAMAAAIHPAAGNWLYFVSSDKAGHLFFTNDVKKFDAASTTCRVRKWGCT